MPLDLDSRYRHAEVPETPKTLCLDPNATSSALLPDYNEKHSSFDKVSKSFPAWTVTRDFWEQALKPEISGIAGIFNCSTSPEDNKYINTVCTGTPYPTRHSVKEG